jgi:hypothetical protein
MLLSYDIGDHFILPIIQWKTIWHELGVSIFCSMFRLNRHSCCISSTILFLVYLRVDSHFDVFRDNPKSLLETGYNDIFKIVQSVN